MNRANFEFRDEMIRSELDISAVRHPNRANQLLVSVQNVQGPVDDLAQANFFVSVWASHAQRPEFFGLDPIPFPVDLVASRGSGFYEVVLGQANYRDGDDAGFLSPDEISACVFTVRVQIPDVDREGIAIAITAP